MVIVLHWEVLFNLFFLVLKKELRKDLGVVWLEILTGLNALVTMNFYGKLNFYLFTIQRIMREGL